MLISKNKQLLRYQTKKKVFQILRHNLPEVSPVYQCPYLMMKPQNSSDSSQSELLDAVEESNSDNEDEENADHFKQM